jgi:hypothetical protein
MAIKLFSFEYSNSYEYFLYCTIKNNSELKMLKYLIMILILFGLSVNIYAEEYKQITLKDSSIIIGKIDVVDGKYVITSIENKMMIKEKSEVIATQSYNLKLSRNNQFEVGATLIGPGGLNVCGGRIVGNHRFRGTFGVLVTDIFAVELEYSYQIAGEKDVKLYLSVPLGHSNFSDSQSWSYTGLNLTSNIYGFDIGAGLTIGTGSFSNPQLAFRIGYVHQFDF